MNSNFCIFKVLQCRFTVSSGDKNISILHLSYRTLVTYNLNWRSARLTTCLGSRGVHRTDYHLSSPWHSTYSDLPPYGNGWCTRACSVVMLSGVDVPGYDNYLDMLTEAPFCAGSKCELWQLSSFFIVMLKAVTA